MSIATFAAVVVRCGMVMLFLPFSALDKLINFDGAVKQAQEIFPPRSIAAIVIVCGLGVEIFMSLGVVSGIGDRACALVIAGYCAATAILFKPFWAAGDFWSSANGKGRTLFWDFIKNLSLGAGFLLIVVGNDGSGLRPFLTHPLISSHPYQPHEAIP